MLLSDQPACFLLGESAAFFPQAGGILYAGKDVINVDFIGIRISTSTVLGTVLTDCHYQYHGQGSRYLAFDTWTLGRICIKHEVADTVPQDAETNGSYYCPFLRQSSGARELNTRSL